MDFLGGDTYWLVRFVFQRGLALLYLVAFLVAAEQFRPLVGERGLLPIDRYLHTARESRPFREGRVFRRSVGTEDRTGRE